MHSHLFFLKRIPWILFVPFLLATLLEAKSHPISFTSAAQINSQALPQKTVSSALVDQALPKSPFNKALLEAIATMPRNGGYRTSREAMLHFQKGVTLRDGRLKVTPCTPSFCSEATYLVFLKTLASLQDQKKISLDDNALKALLPTGVPDGEGIWGRWNANGPGVACLFHDLHLGKNFTNLALAEPGDFLKIFWTNSIGAIEHGHLVIYLGHEIRNGVETIHFWSSNQPMGYSEKWVPLTATKHLLFSRLTNPAAANNNLQLAPCDPYLASLLIKSTTWEEVKKRTAVADRDE